MSQDRVAAGSCRKKKSEYLSIRTGSEEYMFDKDLPLGNFSFIHLNTQQHHSH